MEIQSQVDLYLLYSPNTTGDYTSVKTWTNLEKSIGILVPLVDDSWYPETLQDNSPNVSWTMYFYLVGAGYDIQTDLAKIPSGQNQFPPPQSFTLIQNARNTSQSTPDDRRPTEPNATHPETPNEKSSSQLPSWAIALICVFSVLFLAALMAIVWAVKRYREKKRDGFVATATAHDEKLLVPDHIALTTAAAPTGTSSNHSTPTLLQPNLNRADEKLGVLNEANHSSSILSSTDALLIADTFRQFMRKPEWNEDHEK
ncbi:hypothetical protein G6F43_012256 [Rhizopus delemar]|nr:hypothetical protein G6F43_012256 [Rhizopus delemar]